MKSQMLKAETLEKKEEDIEVKRIEGALLEEVYKWRYEVFCKELGWISSNAEEKDVDIYDGYSVHLGIFFRGEIVGYCRIVHPINSFMLEKDFKDLINNKKIPRKKASVEISRLITKKDLNPTTRFHSLMILYKYMYHHFLETGIRFCYIVVGKDLLNGLQKIFPFRKIGKTVYYQPEVPTMVAVLNIREFEERLEKNEHLKDLKKWFFELKNQAQ